MQSLVRLAVIGIAYWAIAQTAVAQVPALPDIPEALSAEARRPLEAMRAPLATQRKDLMDDIAGHNARCASVRADTPQARDCAATRAPLLARLKQFAGAADKLDDEINSAERMRIINSMNALARRLGWPAGEQARLATALESLTSDGDPNATGRDIRRAWQDVIARGQSAELARKAAAGDGPPDYPGAGTQSFEDCTIFALAHAAGVPYSVVAARATKLISEGDWRDAAARANPQKAIEERGLMGGEVVMMAEALGRAQVVRSGDFAKTLKEGRRLMVNVVPESGDTRRGHAVVLTKAFQHNGETWYEMADSNQGGQQRRYLSAKELSAMLQERGVAFHPVPGRTPNLFR